MERNYETEYKSLVKKTVWGTELRAFFFGYAHEVTEKYFDDNQRRVFDLEHEARERKKDIPMSRENLNLEFRLFEIRTKMVYANLFHDAFPKTEEILKEKNKK